MEHFLLFAIAITVVSFISILMGQPQKESKNNTSIKLQKLQSNLENNPSFPQKNSLRLDNNHLSEAIPIAS